ncbi:hypothetical protein GOBAR_AA36156 [Gossypium barbadense]|uniref:Uncharacterized protein ycf72 n=1 Tax=Gossypium barbadense TaxID=3634 RepID=A0A2P5W0D6_GOSBA|nr:hypothetical protein GOBAR_AA36156 [Gossypium barbadense]
MDAVRGLRPIETVYLRLSLGPYVLTQRHLPSQHLDPALPKLFWFTPTFPTCPTVAEQFLDIKWTSQKSHALLLTTGYHDLEQTLDALNIKSLATEKELSLLTLTEDEQGNIKRSSHRSSL